MSVKPTNWFPHRPTNRFPHRPTNRFPHRPMNRFPQRPTNRFPHRPTNRFPHRSTNQFPHRPMNRFPIWQLFRPKIFAKFSRFISLSRKLPSSFQSAGRSGNFREIYFLKEKVVFPKWERFVSDVVLLPSVEAILFFSIQMPF